MAQSRPARPDEDPSKVSKLGNRFNEAMALALNAGSPMQIAPHLLGISKVNRLFSIMQVHSTILASIVKDGHDPTRPLVGICCETTPESRKELFDHNVFLASQSPMMPKSDPAMYYEKLTNTHYNVALKCGRDGIHSPAGDLAATKANDQSFAEACHKGHDWYILPPDLSTSLKQDIATWRNQDQNENQTLTDGELVRLAKVTVEEYLAKSQPGTSSKVELPLSMVVTATCLKTPLRLNPGLVGGFARFVCQMSAENTLHLVDEFLTEWTATVDPKALAIPHVFFDALCKCEALKGKPYLRLHLPLGMYTEEGKVARVKPQPDSCGFFTQADFTMLTKHAWLCELGEKPCAAS